MKWCVAFLSISILHASWCIALAHIADNTVIQKMHQINNLLRKNITLPEQKLSPILNKAAQDHAAYMADHGKLSHYINGSPGIRAGNFGYEGKVVENIARNYYTVERVFHAWTENEAHWEAIIESHTEVGFGYSKAPDGSIYWVAVYGTPE